MSNDVVLPATGAVVETIDQGGSGTTSATTASGNNTLHFTSTPAFVANGMGISDSTAPTAIPSGLTVLSFTGTTVVMSGNAAGSGVGSGDTIVFTAQRQVVHIGSGSVAISNVNANGSALDAGSAPVAFSTEGKAQLGSLTETAPTSDTASSGLNGRLQRIAQNITTLISSVLTFQLASAANLISGAITTAMTGTTTTSLLAAPGSSLHNMITQVTVSNAHATQGTDIVLQDGSGGTAFYTIPAAANYGGATISFNPPLRQPTANTALFVANVTTGASTKASASGFKAA